MLTMRFYASTIVASFGLWMQYASAAAPPVVFFVAYPTSTAAFRDELIARMDNVSRWACANEPGTTKYTLLVPRSGGDNFTVYSIEQYADDATLRQHLAADMVSNTLLNWWKNTPNLWAKPIVTRNLTALDGMNFVKPEFAKIKNPYFVVDALTYMEGGVEHVLDHWEEQVEASRDESGTLSFGLYQDPTNEDRLYTVAAYESEDYLKNVHLKSDIALEVEHHTEGMRTGLETFVLEKRGGYLYKGSPVCA